MMTLEEARAFFRGDRFAVEQAGITIEEIGEHSARCSMPVTPLLVMVRTIFSALP